MKLCCGAVPHSVRSFKSFHCCILSRPVLLTVAGCRAQSAGVCSVVSRFSLMSCFGMTAAGVVATDTFFATERATAERPYCQPDSARGTCNATKDN